MKNVNDHIIVLHETVTQSWLRDLGTFVMFTALIGLGWMIDSTALQWAGAIIGFITIFSRAASDLKVHRVTMNEAREIIDRLEAGE